MKRVKRGRRLRRGDRDVYGRRSDVQGDFHAKVMAGRRGDHLTRRPNQSEAPGTPSPEHKKSIPADDT